MTNSNCVICGASALDGRCTNELCSASGLEADKPTESDTKANRPGAVTVLCWFMVAGVFLNIYSVLRMFQNREFLKGLTGDDNGLRLQLAASAIGLIVMAVASVAMLYGQNWGRYLLVAWMLIGAIGVLLWRQIDLVTLLAFLVAGFVLAVLFRKESNEYFAGANA